MHRKPKMILAFIILALIAVIYQFSATGFTTKDLDCYDTDRSLEHPKGQNPTKQGTVQGYKWTMFGHKKTEPVTDKCLPFDKSERNRVREYFCEGYKVLRKNIRCPEGTTCQSGACT